MPSSATRSEAENGVGGHRSDSATKAGDLGVSRFRGVSPVHVVKSGVVGSMPNLGLGITLSPGQREAHIGGVRCVNSKATVNIASRIGDP